PGFAVFLRQPPGHIEWSRSSNVIFEQRLELILKFRIRLRFLVFCFEVGQGGHQCFGYETPAEFAEVTQGVRLLIIHLLNSAGVGVSPTVRSRMGASRSIFSK